MLWSGFSLCKEGTTMPCYLTRVLCEFADTRKAPWKWRGLHKSLVLFTQQTFSPENKVINGTIVQLVERIQKFPFTTSRSSCGWLYGLSVLMPSCSQNSGTMDSPGMKSCTVRDGHIMALHHIGQSCVASDFICTSSLWQKGTIAETVATWISNVTAIEKQLSSSTALTNFPSLWMLTIEGRRRDYNYSSSFFFPFWILGPGKASILNQMVYRLRTYSL